MWDKFFLIQKGLIRLFYIDADGNEFNKSFFAENKCIWPVAPRDRRQAVMFNISTIEDSQIVECSFEPVYSLLKQESQWERFALPFAEKLVEQKFHREHDFLLLSATERLKQLHSHQANIVKRLPDYHLASFLGITHISLSRIKKKLTKDNDAKTQSS